MKMTALPSGVCIGSLINLADLNPKKYQRMKAKKEEELPTHLYSLEPDERDSKVLEEEEDILTLIKFQVQVREGFGEGLYQRGETAT